MLIWLRFLGMILGVGFFLLFVLPAFVLMIREAPHLVLLMVALCVPVAVGAKALEWALRPKLLGGRRRPWWR